MGASVCHRGNNSTNMADKETWRKRAVRLRDGLQVQADPGGAGIYMNICIFLGTVGSQRI